MKSWLVNTNSKEDNGNPNGYLFMLRQNKVSSFYNRSSSIDVIEKGDLVLLYHNENRIIAVGFALDSPEHDFEDLDRVEHWVDVNWIWKCNLGNGKVALNSINRKTLGITMVNGAVLNVSSQIDFRKLIEEIGNRQRYF